MTDVIIAGGGVIGLSIAYELAGQGVSVKLLEQGQFGQEASWAGAGILPPGNPAGARTAEAQLRALSHIHWPRWSAQLQEDTGVDNGYRRCGGLEIRLSDRPGALDAEIESWRAEGVDAEQLSVGETQGHEPQLSDRISAAYRLPAMGQVRNPRHVKALIAACADRGVDMRPGSPVLQFEQSGDRIVAARTAEDTHRAGLFVLAGGAWTAGLLLNIGISIPIVPVRGQIVMLSAVPRAITHVVGVGKRYLVPRADGRILVGSTEEHVGFDKRSTATAIAELLDFAVDVVPALAASHFERCWSGLRPGSGDDLPYIGRVSVAENLIVAAGHYRSGLQMSPGTAVLVRQLILEQGSDISLEPFAPERTPRAMQSMEA